MQKIADSHIHCFKSRYDEISDMLDDIAEEGVVEGSLLALPYRSVVENLGVLYAKMNYKKIKLRAFGGFHVTDRYAQIPPEVQAKALLDMGCDGFKMMFSPDLRKCYGRGLDDPHYDKMLTLFEELGTPVNIHLADPEDFWGEGKKYGDDSPTYNQLYTECFNMLDRHPKLRVVFAHFMFLSNSPDEAVRVMEKYPNLYFDLTPGVEMYYNFDNNLEIWREFLEKYSHRILFGTDCNTHKKHTNKNLVRLVYRKLSEPEETFTQKCYGIDFIVKGMGLSEETINRICYENYLEFVGKEPKKVDEEMFIACCKRVKKDLDDNPTDENYIRGGEFVPSLKEDPEQQIAKDFLKKVLG